MDGQATTREKTLSKRIELAKKLQAGMMKSATAKPTDFVFPEHIIAMDKKYPGGFLLGNLNRTVLVYTCQFMGVSAFAPSFIMRVRLRNLMWKLRLDDKLILRDGFPRLSLEELQDAIEARGMYVASGIFDFLLPLV